MLEGWPKSLSGGPKNGGEYRQAPTKEGGEVDQLSGPGCAVVSETYLGAWNVLRRHLAANPTKSRKKNGCIVVALPG